jgi:DNA-binding transcriptional ArsR family regulator
MWQDESVSESENVQTESGASGRPGAAAATVLQVETLKALAAPSRLRILYALMPAGRVMSVKELAEELGEPQTRLYRHVKVLESAGLIEVAATRMVSGIVEQRYRSAHGNLKLDPGAVHSAPQAVQAALVTITTMFIEEFLAAYRAAPAEDAQIPSDEAYRKPTISTSEVLISKEKASEFRNRLQELIDELNAVPEDANGVPVSLLVGFYSLVKTDNRRPD